MLRHELAVHFEFIKPDWLHV